MGWLVGWDSRKELIEHLVENKGGYPVIDHGGSGNEYYLLLDTPTEKYIVQTLLCRSDGKWGYRDIGESMGPTRTNCPERILKQSTCQDPWAVKWRARCREIRASIRESKKKLSTLKSGDLFCITNAQWTAGGEVVHCTPLAFRGFYGRRGITDKPTRTVVYSRVGENQLWKTTIRNGVLVP